MSEEHEVSTFHMKLLMMAVGLLLLSIYFSVTEIRYFFSGKNTEVAIVDTYDFVHKTRRSETPRRGVHFMLPDGDQDTQMAALEFPASWMPPANGKLWVTWIPGSSPLKVRLRGERELIWPLILLAMFTFLGVKAWQIWREASADTEAERRRR